MKKNRILNWKLSLGIIILIAISASYFINITGIEKEGSITSETKTQLLGILIFYNPYVLGLYILIASVLIIKGIKETY